jgi:putative ABC transport system permease protein
MRAFSRACVWLLRRAPAPYRDRFGAEIVSMATARVADEHAWRRLTRVVRELADINATVRRERRREAPAPGAGRLHDLRAALRHMRRRPAASLALAAVLTVGVGASTFGFNLLSTVLLRPLPFGDPDRLVLLWSYLPKIQFGTPDQPIHGLRLRELRVSMATAAGVEGFKADTFNLDADGVDRVRIDGLLTTASLFETLRVRPAAGRFFTTGEDVVGAPCAAVLGYGLWQRLFSGRDAVVGEAIRLNDRGCTIVGVAPRGFEFPRGGEMPASFQYPARTELWVAAPPPQSGPSDLTVLARLGPGASVQAAQAELDAQAIERDTRVRGSRGWNEIRVVPLRQQVVPAGIAATVTALFGAVVALLLVACGNAAQLALVGGLSRRHDLTVRAALGADASRLIRLVAAEAGLVAAASGLAGAALAAIAIRLMRTIGPARFPRLAEATFDARTVMFAAAASVVAGTVAAAAPMWIARRAAGHRTLHPRERGSSDPLRHWRALLIAAQVGMAVVLAVASSLLIHSLVQRLAVPIGFSPDHTLAFELTLPSATYPEVLRGPVPASRPAIINAVDALLSRLRAIPGVTAAAVGKPLPMSGAQEASVISCDGMPPPKSSFDIPIAEYVVVSDQFFRALGSPLAAGREFSAGDREATENVVVVNDSLARRCWPAGSALGRRLKLGGSPQSPAPWLTVVGLAPEMKRFKLDDPPGPAMYVMYTQGGYPTLATLPFAVRTGGRDPIALVPEIRAAVRAAGIDVPVAAATPMVTLVEAASEDARFAMRLMLGIAVVAVGLTVAGLYGTVAFAVSRRRRELGIRVALGAAPRGLVRLVVADAVRPAAWGAALGLPAAAGLAVGMRTLLFGVSPADPWTFILTPVTLAAVVAAACLAPAQRATAVDPRETLRGD